MLVWFDESKEKKTLSYDKGFCYAVPEFKEIVDQWNWDGFEAVAIFADYRTFYRHLQGEEKQKQIITDWNKARNSKLVLTDVKVKSPIFQKAIEAYAQLNYDYLWAEYTTIESEQRKEIEAYATPEGPEKPPEFTPMFEMAKILEQAGYTEADISDRIKALKEWVKGEAEDDKKIAETRRIQRDNIKNSREQLEDLRSKLFSRSSKSGSSKMKIDAYTQQNK